MFGKKAAQQPIAINYGSCAWEIESNNSKRFPVAFDLLRYFPGMTVKSFKRGTRVTVTTNDNKVYTGTIVSTGELRSEEGTRFGHINVTFDVHANW